MAFLLLFFFKKKSSAYFECSVGKGGRKALGRHYNTRSGMRWYDYGLGLMHTCAPYPFYWWSGLPFSGVSRCTPKRGTTIRRPGPPVEGIRAIDW